MDDLDTLPTAFVFSVATINAIEVCLILAVFILACVVTYDLVSGRE